MDCFAPIIIPTLSRYDHLYRCIESLKHNKLAPFTEIFISIDYPPSQIHINGHSRIIDYLNNLDGFKQIHIFIQKSNLGAFANSQFLLEQVRHDHKAFIFIEDDNEFSPNFLEFINKCLNHYSDDSSVIAISGFNYPLPCTSIDGEVYFNSIYFSAFGYGSWIQKQDNLDMLITYENTLNIYNNSYMMKSLLKKAPNQYANFVKGMTLYTSDLIKNGEVYKCDLAHGLFMHAYNQQMLFPTISKVKNWGYDGTGDNCEVIEYNDSLPISHRNISTNVQALDARPDFDKIILSTTSQEAIYTNLAHYFCISRSELNKAKVLYLFSKLFGLQFTRKLVSIYKKNIAKKQ